MGVRDGSRRLLLKGIGGEEALVAEAARRVGEPNPEFYSASSGESTRGIGRPLAVSFLLRPADAVRRQQLRRAIDALAPGGRLLVVDHNQPRNPWARLGARAAAVAIVPWIGLPPLDRLRHPVAREVQDAGLEVLRLRLLAGELVQAVLAQKASSPGGGGAVASAPRAPGPPEA